VEEKEELVEERERREKDKEEGTERRGGRKNKGMEPIEES
jgi:hypothetical protein